MRMILDPKTHIYRDLDEPDKAYTSVSGVLRWVGLKNSWEILEDPADAERRDRAVEFARERGIAVENALYSLLRGEEPYIEVKPWRSDYNGGESLRESVERFLPGAYNWLDTNPDYIEDQVIVADPEAGIAGTLDLRTSTSVVDVKCTSKEEADWKLQVGAYRYMMGRYVGTAVLHINPKTKKGYMWREYDTKQCLALWEVVREAWMRSRYEGFKARTTVESMLATDAPRSRG